MENLNSRPGWGRLFREFRCETWAPRVDFLGEKVDNPSTGSSLGGQNGTQPRQRAPQSSGQSPRAPSLSPCSSFPLRARPSDLSWRSHFPALHLCAQRNGDSPGASCLLTAAGRRRGQDFFFRHNPPLCFSLTPFASHSLALSLSEQQQHVQGSWPCRLLAWLTPSTPDLAGGRSPPRISQGSYLSDPLPGPRPQEKRGAEPILVLDTTLLLTHQSQTGSAYSSSTPQRREGSLP